MSEQEFTYEQKEEAGEKSHTLLIAQCAAQDDSDIASSWRDMIGNVESIRAAEAAEHALQNAHRISDSFYAENKDVLHEDAYDDYISRVVWENGRRYFNETSPDAKWAESNPSAEAMRRNRQDMRDTNDTLYRGNKDLLHEAALREDVARRVDAETPKGKWADLNQMLQRLNIDLDKQSDDNHTQAIHQLVYAGVNPNEIMRRLLPDDIMQNLIILHQNGADIQPDELLRWFGQHEEFDTFFAKKLLKLGADPVEVLAHLKYPGFKVIELVQAGIDPKVLLATLEPHEIAQSLWEFVHAGIEVNVNELVSRMTPEDIDDVEHMLVWAGVDPILLAKRLNS